MFNYINSKYIKICTYSAFLVAVSSILILSSGSIVHAQGVAGLSIQPAIIEDRVDPGQSFSGTIKVSNNESGERTFFIIPQNISSLSDTGQPVFAEEGEITGFELSEWVTIQDSIIIPGGSQASVPFTFNVPEKASPGGHFGGIFFSAEPPRLRNIGAGIGYKVGTIINLRIGGDIIEEASIRAFTTDKLMYGSAEVVFNSDIENRGNVLIRPREIGRASCRERV